MKKALFFLFVVFLVMVFKMGLESALVLLLITSIALSIILFCFSGKWFFQSARDEISQKKYDKQNGFED